MAESIMKRTRIAFYPLQPRSERQDGNSGTIPRHPLLLRPLWFPNLAKFNRSPLFAISSDEEKAYLLYGWNRR
jgi:hypothetical protein